MKNKIKNQITNIHRAAAIAAILLIAFSFCSCGARNLADNELPQIQPQTTEIRVFTNLPDRTNGQGKAEQLIFDAYEKQNPGVKISVEALDDEAYKVKFRAYASGTDMPDLVSVWGQPGFISEIIEAGLLFPLNETDYASYGFIEGSLDGFRSETGELYGLPRNTDVSAFYYNQVIFDRYGWQVPETFGELVRLCGEIRAAGLEPVAIAGADKWPLALFFNDILTKFYGKELAPFYTEALSGAGFGEKPMFRELSWLFRDNASGIFQRGFETQDYGTAFNLFANGRAAMYYNGSWQMSMANDPAVPSEMRENIHVFTMPPLTPDTNGAKDIAAWNGGGHSVTSAGGQRDEALKLLNYMYLPENWSRIAWQNNICMSAQDFAQYKTGNEPPVQLEFTEIVGNAAGFSGTPLNDRFTAQFKTDCENLCQSLATTMITPAQFIAGLTE
ncbi:MAG: extracellular solute-binding protein [Clostridiales bacterium]|jgi:raffinose/stachyose/melibiose transport system substrate-binding protein|nr:extracellular solute-binding protein [Clostridiales bacterium]